jgi:hypothetical protein
VGQRVGQRRRGARLAETIATQRIATQRIATQRFSGVAEAVGRGADIFLDRQEQEDELRDYERLPESSEAFIFFYVAMSRLMVRRLTRS